MDLSETEIKSKVLKGLFWKILENGGAQGIQFVIAIILARLLSPAEYGLVSIIMIFITIANVVVQNGFSTALVLICFLFQPGYSGCDVCSPLCVRAFHCRILPQ